MASTACPHCKLKVLRVVETSSTRTFVHTTQGEHIYGCTNTTVKRRPKQRQIEDYEEGPVVAPLPASAPSKKSSPATTPPKPPAASVASKNGHANPYDAGTQKCAAFALLSDGKLHRWEEFRAINSKYPRDPAGFLEKDGQKNGRWQILKDATGVQMRFSGKG